MTIMQIKSFLEIYKLKKYSDAAAEVGLTQSGLFKQIKSLEDELFSALFEKTPRGIEPTATGRKLYPHFLYIIKQYDEMLLKVQDYICMDEMDLILGAMYFTKQYKIMEMIKICTQNSPNTNIKLDENRANDLEVLLDKKLLDAAFIYKELLQKEYHKVIPLIIDCLVVVMSKKHNYSQKESISLNELKHETFILMRGDMLLYNFLLLCCINKGFVPREMAVDLRLETMKSLVRDNSGITLLMKKMAEDFIESEDMVMIPLEENYKLTLALVTANQTPSSACYRFIRNVESMQLKDYYIGEEQKESGREV